MLSAPRPPQNDPMYFTSRTRCNCSIRPLSVGRASTAANLRLWGVLDVHTTRSFPLLRAETPFFWCNSNITSRASFPSCSLPSPVVALSCGGDGAVAVGPAVELAVAPAVALAALRCRCSLPWPASESLS